MVYIYKNWCKGLANQVASFGPSDVCYALWCGGWDGCCGGWDGCWVLWWLGWMLCWVLWWVGWMLGRKGVGLFGCCVGYYGG